MLQDLTLYFYFFIQSEEEKVFTECPGQFRKRISEGNFNRLKKVVGVGKSAFVAEVEAGKID